VKECKIDMQGKCQRTPDVFTLIGHTGVALMIFESGMHFDFKMARVVGPWACVVAVLGTILPLITGALLTMAFGNPLSPDGLTAGTALAPTSVGISLRLLGEAGVLNLEFGQTIMTAAFVDDIFSLVLFNVIFAMGHGNISFMGTFFPSVMGIVFMLVAVVLAVVFWPWVLRDVLLPKAEMLNMWLAPRDEDDPPKISERDEALFGIMMALLIAYATITFYCGTHLWGCFIAGMSFACLEPVGHPHHVWVKQTKRITSWMIRIFFCCTVAFSIPVDELLQIDAFLKGSLMGIGPCILTKVLCAFFMGPPKFVIGWAMVGRAEFAYLIAQMGYAGNMVSKAVFSILIWALLWATIFAPLIFRLVLNRYIREHDVFSGGLVDGTDHGGHDAHATTRGVAIGDEEDPGRGTNGKTAGSDKKVDTIGKHSPWEDDLGNGNSKAKSNASSKQEKGKCCGLWKKAMM
jgi:Kef-type K+ transport system membrane component KefB